MKKSAEQYRLISSYAIRNESMHIGVHQEPIGSCVHVLCAWLNWILDMMAYKAVTATYSDVLPHLHTLKIQWNLLILNAFYCFLTEGGYYLEQDLWYLKIPKYIVSSLVPRRSLLIRCLREVWERAGEYLSVTSQLMVESRNDRAENAWGLGCIVSFLKSSSPAKVLANSQ